MSEALLDNWPIIATAAALYLLGVYIYLAAWLDDRRRGASREHAASAIVIGIAWPIALAFMLIVVLVGGLYILVFG